MDDLKEIKKLYGEKMSHLCRALFPTILKHPGKLTELLRANFNEDRELYNDLVKNDSTDRFKEFIFNQINTEETKNAAAAKNPSELMDKAGYDLYKCETGGDIKKFKKYYAEDEELCTFRDGENGEGRLANNHIWWAVRKDVSKIKRATNPRREDDYGVSVISIQVPKGRNWLSIKNRYNHHVDNPDATFGNNLDNIIPGLTAAFNREFNLSINAKATGLFNLNNYIMASDGRYYRYNMEINNIYYCPNNIIIDNGEVKRFDKSKYILMDELILSKEKPPSISPYDKCLRNSFSKNNLDCHVKEEKKKDAQGEEYTEITLVSLNPYKSDIKIKLDKDGNIIGLEDKNAEHLDTHFLGENRKLKELSLPNVKRVGFGFLLNNNSIKELEMPQLTAAGNCFLSSNNSLEKLTLKKLTTAGDNFMSRNNSLTELELPELKTVGDDFFKLNTSSLNKINLPKLQNVGNYFLAQNNSLTKLNLPELIIAEDYFLYENRKLTEVNLPKLTLVGKKFLNSNDSLTELNMPELTTSGAGFLFRNESLKKLNLPALKNVDSNFLNYQHLESLEKLNLPLLPDVAYRIWARADKERNI